jgi:hypothetical protein
MRYKLLAVLILVVLLVVPARWAYLDIDVERPARGLLSFLSIVVGIVLAFFLFNKDPQK